METAATGLLYLVALVLFWTSAAKLLPGTGLADGASMAWAVRPGLAAGTIAGVIELIAAVVFLLTALGVLGTTLAAVALGVGIGAHMGVAASRADGDAGESGLPNLVIAALALLVAVLLLL